MGLASAPSRPTAPSDRTGHGHAHWLRVAREAADDLATDAVAREQAGKAPFDEVSRLREAGLLTLLMPAESPAGGPDWLTAYAVVREIATADGAIGQLLGCHYFLSWSARFFTGPALAAQTEERSAAEQWCWGGGFARQEPPLMLVKTSKGLVLDGRQSYTTGVLVADRLAVRAVREDTGEPLAVVVDPTRRGVAIDGDADTFGHRLAAGGSVEFDDVRVGAEDVLGSLSADEDLLSPRAALASPVGRLFSAQLLLGMAEGVLAEAREYSRTGHAAWLPDWPAGTPHDPKCRPPTENSPSSPAPRRHSPIRHWKPCAAGWNAAKTSPTTSPPTSPHSWPWPKPPRPGQRRSPPPAPSTSSAPAPRPRGWASTGSGAMPEPTPCTSPSPTDSAMSATTSSTALTLRSSCPPDREAGTSGASGTFGETDSAVPEGRQWGPWRRYWPDVRIRGLP